MAPPNLPTNRKPKGKPKANKQPAGSPSGAIAPVKKRPRPPGRPRAASNQVASVTPLLSREQLLERATELAKAQPLAELSMVGLAREFGVTPALIHYYVGSRDDLISGVVNRYFKARVERLDPPSGDWRRDLEAIARSTYDMMIEYGGVLRYVVNHNRFRLFQKVAVGEIDYGLAVFDHIARIFRTGGFTAEQGALGYHLLMQQVLALAYSQVGRQLPGDHRQFVYEQLSASSRDRYPGAHFIAEPFSRLDHRTVFDAVLVLTLDGFAAWRRGATRGRNRSRTEGGR